MFVALFFFYYFSISNAVSEELQLKNNENPIEEYILCRSCGSDIADSHYLFSNPSPESSYKYNDTIFNKENILIQIFPGSISLNFALITSRQSYCEVISEWQWEDSWFPGYTWKPCVCPDCGAHVGWVFENPDNSIFFGLILTHLVGESFVDSLMKYPGYNIKDNGDSYLN